MMIGIKNTHNNLNLCIIRPFQNRLGFSNQEGEEVFYDKHIYLPNFMLMENVEIYTNTGASHEFTSHP
jgi:hypothetical protein